MMVAIAREGITDRNVCAPKTADGHCRHDVRIRRTMHRRRLTSRPTLAPCSGRSGPRRFLLLAGPGVARRFLRSDLKNKDLRLPAEIVGNGDVLMDFCVVRGDARPKVAAKDRPSRRR